MIETYVLLTESDYGILSARINPYAGHHEVISPDPNWWNPSQYVCENFCIVYLYALAAENWKLEKHFNCDSYCVSNDETFYFDLINSFLTV